MKNLPTPVLFANALRTIAADSRNQPTPQALDLGFAILHGNWQQVATALPNTPCAEISNTPGIAD